MQVKDFNALKNFILNNQAGVRSVINYASVSAARDYVFNQKLMVNDYNDDDSKIVAAIKNANLSLSEASFAPTLKNLIDDFIFNAVQTAILDGATIKVPDALRPHVIQLMKKSTVPIDANNIDFFLPLLHLAALARAAWWTTRRPPTRRWRTRTSTSSSSRTRLRSRRSAAPPCSAPRSSSTTWCSATSSTCSARSTTSRNNYLLRGGIEIQDTTLRNDLQLYVFSNKFVDLKTEQDQRPHAAGRARDVLQAGVQRRRRDDRQRSRADPRAEPRLPEALESADPRDGEVHRAGADSVLPRSVRARAAIFSRQSRISSTTCRRTASAW